jgi:hypothetical protein
MRHRKSRWGRSEKARHETLMQRLSAPITPDRIATFVKHLVAVSFGAESECWFYVGCGKGTTLPDDLAIKMTSYANLKFNRETVGPHQFAYCASEGITLVELAGFDVHHAAEFGRCIGYRCCNPEHLNKVPTPLHRRRPAGNEELTRRQIKIVREVLGVPANARRPVEHLSLSGAGVRRRFLGGLPFLIRGGDLQDILEDAAEPIDA